MITVFDNGTFNYDIIQKLYLLFEIDKYKNTFIGECEKLLTCNFTKIDRNDFIDGSLNIIKNEYIKESLSIGVSLTMTEIISYKPFFEDNMKDKLINELKKMYNIYQTFYDKLKNNYKNTDYEETFNYLFNIILIQKHLKKIIYKNKNIMYDDNTIYNNYNNEIVKNLIKNTIYSIKEARDSYYLEEIKQMKNDNIILITNDLILSLRAIYENINCIHTYQNNIQYISFYQNDNMYFINNPFDFIIKGDYRNDILFNNLNKIDTKRKILENILSNPIAKLKLSKNKKVNIKYLKMDFRNDNNNIMMLCEKYNNLSKLNKNYKNISKMNDLSLNIKNILQKYKMMKKYYNVIEYNNIILDKMKYLYVNSELYIDLYNDLIYE